MGVITIRRPPQLGAVLLTLPRSVTFSSLHSICTRYNYVFDYFCPYNSITITSVLRA